MTWIPTIRDFDQTKIKARNGNTKSLYELEQEVVNLRESVRKAGHLRI